MVQRQLQAVFDQLPPAAVKLGMLYSPLIANSVVAFFRQHQRPPLVVDPVMIATSGAKLLKPAASKILREQILPLATLVMPNLPEAEVLTDLKLHSIEDLREAARAIRKQFGCSALVKGGHLAGSKEAVDVFWDGRQELLLRAPFVRGLKSHGTGCTYSAAVTAFLARRYPLTQAVKLAKEFITQAIARSQTAAGHSVLNSFWSAVS
jgi:hydroxymethylpyrimidine/phosphomethylpyrimidine kinase